MIYGFRIDQEYGHKMLIEAKSVKELERLNFDTLGKSVFRWRATDRHTAHHWVKNGRIHETGLYIDYDGHVRYAKEDLS